MMAQLEHGHCTARSTVLAAPPAMVKDKSGEGGQTAVGLDPINEGVQPDVLQRGWAGMARSVLNPLLFAAVMDVVSSEARSGLPSELLYADDLVWHQQWSSLADGWLIGELACLAKD